jgi:indolepyruvate ferredoxin oxidoreductase, beta subunit
MTRELGVRHLARDGQTLRGDASERAKCLTPSQRTTILIAAMGGEGGGVLSQWITDALEAAGWQLQYTAIPGVAQRTGATTYYIECLRPDPAFTGEPVFSLLPMPGKIDIAIATELAEAGRMVEKGYVTPDRTLLIGSTHRVYATSEKLAMADGRMADAPVLAAARTSARAHQLVDFAKLAEQAGAVINAPIFGAFARFGELGLSREACEAAMRRDGHVSAANAKGFELGWQAIDAAIPRTPVIPGLVPGTHGAAGTPIAEFQARATSAASSANGAIGPGHKAQDDSRGDAAEVEHSAIPRSSVIPGLVPGTQGAAGTPTAEFQARAANAASSANGAVGPGHRAQDDRSGSLTGFALDVLPWLTLCTDRLTAYQSKDYAALFLKRLQPFQSSPSKLVTEIARELTLWMAFNDIIRVAELKLDPERIARIAGEAKLKPGDTAAVIDYFKPGVEEVAAVLPPGAARTLRRWAERSGVKERLSIGIHLPTSSIRGQLMLRSLTALKRWRPLSDRYLHEQANIERWLAGLTAAAKRDPEAALEFADCARLLKGYGDTWERGARNFALISDALPAILAAPQPARVLAALRAAALADPDGTALAEAFRTFEISEHAA